MLKYLLKQSGTNSTALNLFSVEKRRLGLHANTGKNKKMELASDRGSSTNYTHFLVILDITTPPPPPSQWAKFNKILQNVK